MCKQALHDRIEAILQETEKGKIPESVLRECKKFISLDKNLDRKAKKNNMTSKQVCY